jgi:hypothetical protein
MMYVIPLTVGGSILSVGTNAHDNPRKRVGAVRNAHELINSEGESTMTRFKLFGVAAVVSVAMAAPVMAQQAVQEPGEQAFYQSLGVGSSTSGSANAMASVGGVNLSAAPARHHVRASSKHNLSAQRQ